MAPKEADSRPLITRRVMLAQAAQGAVLVSMSPYLNHARSGTLTILSKA